MINLSQIWDHTNGLEISSHHTSYMSGYRSQFSNYSLISILSIISEIAERIVHKQSMKFIEESHLLLYSHQFGFLKGMSTEQAVTLFLDDIQSNVYKGKLFGACFIDCEKHLTPSVIRNF